MTEHYSGVAIDNSEMRVLFAELAARTSDWDLRADLLAASDTDDAPHDPQLLRAANRELSQLLIRLHIHAESAEDQYSQRRIWELLRNGARRKLYGRPS